MRRSWVRWFLALALSFPSVAWAGSLNPDTACTLDDSVVAYYKLDEASGTRNDSVSTNHLTDNNTVTQAAGKVGNAAQFTAANLEWLDIADNAAMSTGAIQFVYATWIYVDSFSASGRVIAGKGTTASTAEWLLRLNGADKPALYTSSTGLNIICDTTWGSALSTATWYFLAGWHDSSAYTNNISVNNGTTVSCTDSSEPVDRTGTFFIGQNEATQVFLHFDGRQDEALWGKFLPTAQHLTDLYNGGSGNTYDSTGTCTIPRAFVVSQASLWANPLELLGCVTIPLLPRMAVPGPGSIGRALYNARVKRMMRRGWRP